MNYMLQPQQNALPAEQWSTSTPSTIPPNHLTMPPQHQQSHAMNNMQSIPLQHPQSINNKYDNMLPR